MYTARKFLCMYKAEDEEHYFMGSFHFSRPRSDLRQKIVRIFRGIHYWMCIIMDWMVSYPSVVIHSMNVDSVSWSVNVVIGKHKRVVSLFQSWWWCDIPSALCGWRYRHAAWYTAALGGGSWTRFPPFLIPSLRYGTALGSWLYLRLLMSNIAVFHHALNKYLHVWRLQCYSMQLFLLIPILYKSLYLFHLMHKTVFNAHVSLYCL